MKLKGLFFCAKPPLYTAACCAAKDTHTGGAALHRALQLARQIGAKDEADQIEAALLDVFFDAANSTDFAALHYLQPLLAEKRAGARAHDIVEQLEKIGRRHLAAAHPFPAQSYFEASSDWYQRAGRAEKQADMLAVVAEAITLQAEQGDGAMIEHSWLALLLVMLNPYPVSVIISTGENR